MFQLRPTYLLSAIIIYANLDIRTTPNIFQYRNIWVGFVLEVQKVAKMIHVHIRSRANLTSSLTVPGKALLFPYGPSRFFKICSRSHPLTWGFVPLTHACLISLPIPVTLTYYCNLSFSWILLHGFFIKEYRIGNVNSFLYVSTLYS